jgi:antitoxin ParD1/3/4
MQQITLELSDDLFLHIQQQIDQGVFNDINEYLLYLLNQDKTQRQSLQLEKMLIEGLDSGETIELTEDWWEAKRQQLFP